jgi:hypothetical protein
MPSLLSVDWPESLNDSSGFIEISGKRQQAGIREAGRSVFNIDKNNVAERRGGGKMDCRAGRLGPGRIVSLGVSGLCRLWRGEADQIAEQALRGVVHGQRLDLVL